MQQRGTFSLDQFKELQSFNNHFQAKILKQLKNDRHWLDYWQQKKSIQDQIQQIIHNNCPIRLKQILIKGIPINLNQKYAHNNTALHIAAFQGFSQLVQILINSGSNIEAKTSLGRTPLIVATIACQLQCVKILVTKKCWLNVQDYQENTAIHHAAMNGFKEILLYLIQSGADCQLKNNLNNTPRDCAIDSETIQIIQSHTKIAINNSYSRTIIQDTIFCNSRSDHVKKLINSVKSSILNAPKQIQQKSTNKNIKKRIQKTYYSNVSVINIQQIKYRLQDFLIQGMLGKGSFGQVYLAKAIKDDKLYAIKSLDKAKVVNNNLIRYAFTQRNILRMMNHPFIVNMFSAFQNQQKLFMLMQYCPCGDLQKLIFQKKKLLQQQAKLYICQIILAIQALHNKQIIFRDLKPANIVLDQEGHAKLTDFGLSKQAYKSKSFCGSVAYLAPQMIRKQIHGFTLDWYLVGVVLYQMLAGQPPFYINNKQKLFQNILKAKLKFPLGISQNCRKFLQQILQRDPNKRLGSINDASDIKEHKFFSDVDWNQVYKKKKQMPKISKRQSYKISSFVKNQRPQKQILGWSFIK